MSPDLDTVLALVQRRLDASDATTRLIAVDGPSGSGKSTLARPPLLDGRDAVFQARDWEGDEFGDGLGEWRTVPWAPVVVLEGVTCSRLAISDRLACRLWIEAAPADRLQRGLRRDGESHRGLWDRWMVEETAFFAEDRTRERADLVVDGTA